MANYAYLRVSTGYQDVDNQHHDILEYANEQGRSSLQFVEDAISGRVAWRERRIGELLLNQVVSGDIVLFAEISRMARSKFQVLGEYRVLHKKRRRRPYSEAEDGFGWVYAKSNHSYGVRSGG